MNEILGITIPMLMSGSSVMDVIKALGGTSGAAGMDGLESMMRAQAKNARDAYPLVQNKSTISNAAEMLLDRLGINPYTGLGQGLSSFLGNMYHIAPDTIGTILGVPYGGQFFSTIANGASGINEAAGRGSVDIFNPYSVMSAHENTRNLARRMYDFGVKANGGYDISYGHGLNMGEMGKVAQRILSSRIPYMDEDGRRLDLFRDEKGNYKNDQDVEKFNLNLKKLGSKFNDTASMLAKMTGSIDEALKVMDRMAGGNFLGGSAEQAKSVAERARHMAAAIRITSAIAGTSPQEAYANMQGLAQTMSAGIGMNPYIANQSGYTAMMGNMAYHATAAYGMWSAMNPTATQEQRAQALLAANGRATRYASENGAAFSAMIADNRDLFSEEELKRAEVAIRTGNPNVIQKMIRDKIGADRYSRYMTDPAFQIAARYRATMPGNEARAETLRSLDIAGMEGGLQQAETEGNKMLMRSVLSDLDLDLSNVTGKGGSSLRKERDDFALRRLRQMAQGYGLDSNKVSGMGEDELVEFLEKRPGMDSVRLGRILNTSKIEAAEQQIDRMTMTGSEDSSARIRARSAIRSSNAWNSQGKNELIRRIDAGEDLDAVMTDFISPMKAKDARNIRKDVMQGKLTAEQARVEKARFADLKDLQRIDASTRETMDSLREDVKRSEIQDAGLLKGFAASEGFGDLADKFALEKYSGGVGKLLDSGKVSIGDDDRSLTKTYETAARNIVSRVFKNDFGSMSTEDANKLVGTMAKDIVMGIRSGKTMGESFASSLGGLSDEQKKAIGSSRFEKIVEDAKNENSKMSRTDMNIGSLINESTSVIEKETEKAGMLNMDAGKALRSLAGTLGRKGIKDDRSALNQFRNQIKQFKEQGKVSFSVDDKSLSEMFSKGGQRMVLDVLGGEGKRLGNLEGDGLQELAASVHSKMIEHVNQGKSLDEGFALAIGNLSEDKKKAIGKDGMEQIQRFIDQSKKGGIEGISANNYISGVIGVADEKNKESRMAAVDRMDELLKGNFGKKGMAGATKEFMDLSKQVGLFKGDDKEAAKVRTDAVKSFVSDAMGAYGVGDKDQAEIVAKAEKTVDTKFGGDYSKAIQAATMDRAKATGNKKLASLAKAVGGRDDVNTSIMGSILKKMKPEVKRKPSFAAIAQSGSADLAAVNMAAVSASLTGLDMGEVLMNQFAPDLLSATDASVADASMNRIPNALQIGANTFAKTAIDKTKTQMANLGKALRDNGIKSEATLKLALSDEKTDKAKKAREDLGRAVGGYNTAEGQKNLNLLRTINEGAKIGGKSAYEVMMGGEEAIKNISKTNGADKDVLNLTRESNRKDSDSYKILDTLGKIAKDISSFLDTHVLNVNVKGGSLNVSGSNVKVNTDY